MRPHLILCFVLSFVGNFLFGQEVLRADVVLKDSLANGFDTFSVEHWRDQYEVIQLNDTTPYYVPYVSVKENSNDTVLIRFTGEFNSELITFHVEDSLLYLPLLDQEEDQITTILPAWKADYSLEIRHADSLIGKLNVIVYPEQREQVILVPMFTVDINADSLEQWLNDVYGQAQLNLDLTLAPLFSPEDFEDTLFSNPSLSHDRFTEQMILVRDAYFDSHITENRKAYYVFLVPGFVDEQLKGYMVRNKGVAFVKNSSTLYRDIARTLGYGIGVLDDTWLEDGPEMGTTSNLMDTSGLQLTYLQWQSIQRSCHSVSYFDDYEDVRTNSGIIAYYFWEEDADGNIVLSKGSIMNSIFRPFKRNQYSLHLDIDSWFFRPLFEIRGYKINFLHLLSLVVLFVGSIFLRRRLYRIKWKVIEQSRLLKRSMRLTVFVLFICSYYGSFTLVNEGYFMFEVESGKLVYLNQFTTKEAIKEIRENKNYTRIEESNQGSEILIKKGDHWLLEKRKKVLYFNVTRNGEEWTNCQFNFDSDSLMVHTKDFKEFAESHYMVFNYMEDGVCQYQKVYNHLGKEITDKLVIDDPAKRILLFVNGYRPTSIGSNFEENFEDIQKNGLEFDNSKNLIYDFDRYDYWRPWKEIDLLFKNRINPSDVFYADGHFSVATSNHQSLLGFTVLTNSYPNRCSDLDHHICQKKTHNWEFYGIKTKSNTSEMLATKPNKRGFRTRVTNGQVAGRNLEQIFNELPNKSANDTIYIVAHSMGYAYALGIIEKLRGKINFGGLYIMAPENASSGNVHPEEWNEVWQYGSDFERYRYSAPCLLDGIATQTGVGGLPLGNRTYVPDGMMGKMGFFNTHFIGYYTWIFDIPKNETGYIRQR